MKPLPQDIVFLAAKRTAFGTYGGSLKDVSATDLGVIAAKAAIAESKVAPADIDHVVFGNVMQTSADAIYLARHVGLKAGLPIEKPALTVNRLCGSGFEAVIQAAQLILTGEANVVLAGGTESMSQAPYAVRNARFGIPMGRPTAFEDTLTAGLTDSFCNTPMAITAENLAVKYGITQDDVDQFSVLSQQRFGAAQAAGRFAAEIAAYEQTNKKGEVLRFDRDEHGRPETTVEKLRKLPKIFKKDGVIHAGAASGVCDGASALIVASASWAAAKGLTPIGRLVGWGVAGVPPELMGIGPAPAIRAALAKADAKLSDFDLFEVNEAFAPQYLAVEKELGLPRDRTNVNGGAIAVGHPLAASGARITSHLLHELKRSGAKRGIGSACIGGGQGIAVLVESI